MRCPLQNEMDSLGLTDHCRTLGEVNTPSEMCVLAGVPKRAAANCRREKGAGAVGAGAAMIRRVVKSRPDGWGGVTSGVRLIGKRGRRD